MKHVTVYPKAGRPVWYAAFPCPRSGKRIFRATEFRRDDPAGERKAWDWARAQAREGLLARKEGGRCEWGNWVEPWLRLKYRKQNSSLTNALNWWSWVSLYLREQGCATPRALDRDLVMGYIPWRLALEKRNGRRVCFNSALQEVKFLGRVMREAILRKFAEVNPAEKLGLKKDKAPEKPEISDAEVALIRGRLAVLEGHLPLAERWMSVSFEIALHQGCRAKATQIPMERIDLEAGTIRFHEKRDQVFTVPIHPELRPLLEALRAEGAVVTCRLPKGSAIRWTKFFKGRREPDRSLTPFLPHLCFHCTRVTVITRLARAGVPIQQAMAYVHHASELIHRIYQRLKAEDLRGCHAALCYQRRECAA